MMFPSNSSCNGDDDQAFFYRPFLTNINDINMIIPNSKQQQQQQNDPLLPLPSPTSTTTFFSFPSPFEEEQAVQDLLLQNNSDLVFQSLHELQPSDYKTTPTAMAMDSSSDAAATTTTMNIQKNHIVSSDQNNARNTDRLVPQPIIPRKRTCKRDRHSKINTARGPRDRRMRLSLEVARKFFGLQDMLGFDKASKTVEWLLVRAKSEIKNLERELKQPIVSSSSCSAGSKSTTTCSTSSECEVISGEVGLMDATGDHHGRCGRKPETTTANMKKKKKKKRPITLISRKNAFHPIARESRDKARERARERTREKRRLLLLVGGGGGDESQESKNNQDIINPSRLGSFEITGEDSVGTQSQNMNNINPTYSLDMVDDDSSIFNSLHHSTGIISQEHQFADFQFFGKPWDICNTHNVPMLTLDSPLFTL